MGSALQATGEQLPGPRVVTLGTAGGPRWWARGQASERCGISTAIIVEDGFYLVDCGHGVGRRIHEAGLDLKDLRGIFITHLHSDHTIDLGSLAIFGLYELGSRVGDPVPIFGPGDRGMLPPLSPRAATMPDYIAPQRPTPGTKDTFALLMEAFATDLNDRIIDSLRPSPHALFAVSDIEIPPGTGYHPNDNPTPEMEPFVVFEDENVVVSAILVEHPPIAPAFAFRFETRNGSVTLSGDTAPTPNMITLASGTGLLLHEAIDFDYIDGIYAGTSDPMAVAARDHHYKSHTSAADAARIATKAGARRLALHHLVPGTAPRSVWEDARLNFTGDFYLPDDLATIPFGTQEQ